VGRVAVLRDVDRRQQPAGIELQAQRAAGGQLQRARQRHGDAVDVTGQVIGEAAGAAGLGAVELPQALDRGEDIAAGPAPVHVVDQRMQRIAGREPVRVGMVGLGRDADREAQRAVAARRQARQGLVPVGQGGAEMAMPAGRTHPAAIAGLQLQAREHQVEPADRQRPAAPVLHRAKPVGLQCPAGPVDDLQRDPWRGCLWCG